MEVHRHIAHISDIKNLSLLEIVSEVRAATHQLKAHQLNHKQLWSEHLEALANAIVLESNPALIHDSVSHVRQERVRKTIKQIIRRKNMRKTYR